MKVCFIDTWLALENFGPIHKALKLKGIDSMLIHTSSFDSSNIEKKEQIINGMLCRDISFYNTRFIYNAIKFEIELPQIGAGPQRNQAKNVIKAMTKTTGVKIELTRSA